MKFSLITTVYNTNPYINDYIESVNAIKYEDLEIIVVNDGSIDGVVDYLKMNIK